MQVAWCYSSFFYFASASRLEKSCFRGLSFCWAFVLAKRHWKKKSTYINNIPSAHTHTPFFCLPEKLVPFVDTAWVVTTSCAYSNMRLEKKDLHVAVAAALVNRAGRRCEAVTATMIERPSFVKCTCWKWIAVACSSMWFMEGNSSFCSLCPQPFAVFI